MRVVNDLEDFKHGVNAGLDHSSDGVVNFVVKDESVVSVDRCDLSGDLVLDWVSEIAAGVVVVVGELVQDSSGKSCLDSLHLVVFGELGIGSSVLEVHASVEVSLDERLDLIVRHGCEFLLNCDLSEGGLGLAEGDGVGGGKEGCKDKSRSEFHCESKKY